MQPTACKLFPSAVTNHLSSGCGELPSVYNHLRFDVCCWSETMEPTRLYQRSTLTFKVCSLWTSVHQLVLTILYLIVYCWLLFYASRQTKTTTFKNYSFYNLPGEESNGNSHGGVAILVNNAIPHSHIQLNTSLQAIAVRATFHKTISVCSIYLSPSSKFNISDFDNIITQLPAVTGWGWGQHMQ